MSILYGLLFISIVINIILVHLNRNWKYTFTEKFNKNEFSKEKSVNVELERKGKFLNVLIVTPSSDFFFNVVHNIEESERISGKKKEKKEKQKLEESE